MITRAIIQLKIKQYQNQRDKRANEMTNELATYNGAIEALSQLLEETAEQPSVNGEVSQELAGVLHE
jgi:ribonuclease HI